MSEKGQLAKDPLFVGLTRPTMILGVSTGYAMVNMMITVVVFINYSSFLIIPISVVVHLIGYIACFNEPRIVEIITNKLSKCNKCPNKTFHGANSYKV